MDHDMWKPLALVAALGVFFGVRKAVDLHAQGWPTWLLVTLGVLIVVLLVVMVVVGRRVFGRRDGRAAMGSAASVAVMTGRDAKQRGKALRPSLASADRKTQMREYGSLLGTVGRSPVYKSWEDVAVVFMGPRSNKTSAIAVPGILSAPGAVVATSNKPDLWMLTAALRHEVGAVYVLDPQRIAFVPQTWWWNPLSAVTDIDSAERLASHFMREVDGGGGTSSGSSAFFNRAASQTLQRLILAAAVSGRSLRDVASWIATRSPEPTGLLADHGFGELAEAHEADLEGPVETRGGIYATVAAAVSCLNVESVARWITPPTTWRDPPTEPIAEFDPWTLVASEVGGRHPTLYLLSREGSGTSRVLVAALVDRVFEVAGLAATARGGRVDPPITVMLDEAANVCRIDALPDLYSFFGSQGISVTTILQSYKQGVRVWGKDGMDALWSAATVAIAGAGLKDMEFCKTLSDLVGQHEVDKRSHSSSNTGSSQSTSTHWEPIMRPEEVAALPKTKALLFSSGASPVTLTLKPWYAERDADQITDYNQTATGEVTNAAVAYLGPRNALAQALQHSGPVEAPSL